MQIQSFINSEFQKGSSSFEKKNPYTQAVLHTVDNADMLHLVQAFQGAQKAFLEWKKSSLEDRRNLLQKISAVLESRKVEFAALEAWDQGLPLTFIAKHDLDASIHSFQTAVEQLKLYQNQDGVSHSANGAVVIVGSWNLSLRVISERLAPALAAGNAVIIKVSSAAPATALILAELCKATQVPAGLIQVIVSELQETKDLLINHPSVKAISFVGQLRNASDILKKVASLSLNQFKKVQLATGSKNTAVCLSEPDDGVFQSVINSFMLGQGQLSWNSNRLFILEKFEQQWVEKIQSYLASVKPAMDIYDESAWTPCIKADSFSHFSEIEQQAQKDQARLIQATAELSELQKKCFLRPTFTKDMSNCSTLQQDQVMAPLFILSVVKYPFDIAKYSNVSYYGLSAHIWAEESKIGKVAEQLDVAHVYKNQWSVERNEPQMGVKQSGFGIQDYRVFGEFFSNVKKLT